MPKNITVQKIINILLQRLKFIILVSLIGTLSLFLYSKVFITPMYSTSSMILIQNFTAGAGINEEYKKIYTSDINGSATLANTCVTIFQNSDDFRSVYNGCGVSISVNSYFMTFTVTGSNPQLCADVANNLMVKAEEVFYQYFAYGHIGALRSATVPGAPFAPNNMQYGTKGFIGGLAVSVAIAILLELIDSTIKPDDDLQKLYDLPVFAEIPDFNS